MTLLMYRCKRIWKRLETKWNVWGNRILTAIAIPVLVVAILSLPLPFQHPFSNLSNPQSTTQYRFTVDANVTSTNPFLNGSESARTKITHVAEVLVTLTGNGGSSAGNPILMKVTLYFNNSQVLVLGNVSFKPIGAYKYPIEPDSSGFPKFSEIRLKKVGDKWIGEDTVIYYKGGDRAGQIILDTVFVSGPFGLVATRDPLIRSKEEIHIGSEEVTVGLRNSSIIISLTLFTLLIAILELRKQGSK